jgi:hypothetical protein
LQIPIQTKFFIHSWLGTNPDGKWPKFENGQSRHPDEIDDRLIKLKALVQTNWLEVLPIGW